MNKKGFTLVELLAVIVILAIILVIAVPQIGKVVKKTRINTIGSTAKLISAKAEEKEVEIEASEINENITCENLVKMDDNYGECNINVVEGKYIVTVTGSETGKFKGITCVGTKDKVECNEGEEVVLTVELNGGETTQQFETLYLDGTKITLQEPTKEGYRFVRWEVTRGNSRISNNELTIGTENTTIYAVWEANIRLTVELNGGTKEKEVEGTYETGNVVELWDSKKAGNSTSGWEIVSGNSILSGNTLTIGTEDTVVRAKFTECTSGTYNDGTSTTCSTCTGDKTSAEGANSCTVSCTNSTGVASWSEAATCTAATCNANYYKNGANCTACAGGTTTSEGNTSTSCSACSNNTGVSTWDGLGCTVSTCSTNYQKSGNSCVLSSPYSSYSCANKKVGTSPYVMTYTGNCTVSGNSTNWYVKFTSSGTLKFSVAKSIDAFLVGGGGGGGKSRQNASIAVFNGGGGGGGGYRTTKTGISLSANTNYGITIGAGGGAASAGGATTAFSQTANGGGAGDTGDQRQNAGIGGSNGGKGGYSYEGASTAGSAGADGVYAFGDSSIDGIKYGAGGGGGGAGGSWPNQGASPSIAGKAGGASGGGTGGTDTGSGGNGSYGGGGGGGGPKNGGGLINNGGAGGSGIVIIRNKR